MKTEEIGLNQLNIEIQDHTGDRKLTLNWEPGDKTAEQFIESTFLDLQKAGYRFYSVKRVLGLFKKKGKEVNHYDPSLGELIYEHPIAFEDSQNKGSLTMFEADKNAKVKYEDHKKYNPTTEPIDTSRDYVATKKMRAG